MNTHIRERLRADALAAIEKANHAAHLPHLGLRGRFRELLVNEILSPWLPPYAECGTGMIVDAKDRARESTQEDIVIFDRSLTPPVLASPRFAEGLFPIDCVLLRVEVKSQLTRDELRKSLLAANEVNGLDLAAEDVVRSRLAAEGRAVATTLFPSTGSVLFAFGSDLSVSGDSDAELTRLVEVTDELGLTFDGGHCQNLPTPIAALCVVGRGFWFLPSAPLHGEPPPWLRAKIAADGDELLGFVGITSNQCFSTHVLRQGRSELSVEGGVGRYILGPEHFELVVGAKHPERKQSIPSVRR